jgi:phage terminase large subunit-like protein
MPKHPMTKAALRRALAEIDPDPETARELIRLGIYRVRPDGRLHNGKCGAYARSTGKPCQRKAHENGRCPHTRAPLANPDDYVSLVMNPILNLDNLPPDYMPNLDTLPEKQRLRFKEGQWLSELDNALWTYDSFRHVPVSGFDCQRIVVAVDPSGASGREDVRSDEIGIIVAAKLKSKRYAVLADRSLRAAPHEWARVAVGAFKEFGADLVVAEKNFGGSLVEANLRNEDRNIPVKLVTASRGKAVRAEPIAHLYARREVDHAATFAELEQQATEMTTAGFMGQRSPDRLDAMVWALSELSGSSGGVQLIGVWGADGFEPADPNIWG